MIQILILKLKKKPTMIITKLLSIDCVPLTIFEAAESGPHGFNDSEGGIKDLQQLFTDLGGGRETGHTPYHAPNPTVNTQKIHSSNCCFLIHYFWFYL